MRYLVPVRSKSGRLTTHSGKLVVKKPKLETREARREAKALTAARLEKALEKELVSRLKSRAYGDAPLNVNEDVWRGVLEAEKARAEGLELEDEESEEEDEELCVTQKRHDVCCCADDLRRLDELDEAELEREFISDFDESDEELEDRDSAIVGEDDVRFLPVLVFLQAHDRRTWEKTRTPSSRTRLARSSASVRLRRTRGAKPEHDVRSLPPAPWLQLTKRSGPRLEIEYETELAPPAAVRR